MPSGFFYDRGLIFSYAAWASGRIFGDGLPSYRLPSFVGGVASVVLTALVATRLGGSPFVAGFLALAATWLVVASTWARFYGLFVAAFLATTLTLLDPLAEDPRRGRWFLAGLIATRLLHEMAVTLVALPLFLFLQSRPASGDRRWSRALLLQSVGAMAAVQLALGALTHGGAALAATALIDTAAGAPRVVPALLTLSSATGLALLGLGALGLGLLLRPLGASWSCCAIAAACTATLNLGLLAIATVALMLAHPDRTRVTAVAGVALGLATVALWTLFASCHTAAGFNWDLASSLGLAGMAFPLTGAAQMAGRWPLAAWAAVAGLVAGWRVRNVRSIAFLALASVVFLGTITLGPKPRYFLNLFPLLFAMAAILPVALRERLSAPGWLPRVASTGLALLMAGSLLVEHERAGRDLLLEPGGPFGLSRLRTSPYERWAALLRNRATEGPIVCNDDLGCLLLGRNPTYWWLGSEIEAATYGFRDAGGWRSTYTGVRILVGDEAARAFASEDLRGAWVIALDTVKYARPSRITPSDVWQGLEPVCQAEGMLVLRVPRQQVRVGSAFGKETIPCSSG